MGEGRIIRRRELRRVQLEQVEENKWKFEYTESIVLLNEKLYRGIDLSRYSVYALRNLNGENSTPHPSS